MTLQATAEHEAAHAVVARYLGVPVRRVWIDPATLAGRTECDKTGREYSAVILAAGDLWCREFSTQPYEDRACSDLRRFERNYGLNHLWGAERKARAILSLHRAAVLTFAGRLMREHDIVLTQRQSAA